jgi:hypothetical protein
VTDELNEMVQYVCFSRLMYRRCLNAEGGDPAPLGTGAFAAGSSGLPHPQEKTIYFT